MALPTHHHPDGRASSFSTPPSGGIKAVTWADVQQMAVILGALVLALVIAISLLPHNVSFMDAVRLAGAAGKLNAVDLAFRLERSLQLWSGLIGGKFLLLAYFGTRSEPGAALSDRQIDRSKPPEPAV